MDWRLFGLKIRPLFNRAADSKRNNKLWIERVFLTSTSVGILPLLVYPMMNGIFLVLVVVEIVRKFRYDGWKNTTVK